ncbi:hypothetical protein [Paludibaculum fermentans]|uniref:Carboxypeptidase regulatory-like domain-containing protein n=1 Tax=Paludibaculum fermentans TaxID=1473598 RepID=A0A7S7NSQ6_PALFE|nr:hypothetical protein [Paludibaculum fermentans]QOY89006.1 hypothetical protein IRI77_03340 [Paludibaculum fermentans]
MRKLIVSMFLVLPQAVLLACQCSGPATPCAAAAGADAVFTGTVISISSPTQEARRLTGKFPEKPMPGYLVRLRVGSVLHGVPAGQEEMEIGTDDARSCGFGFEVGQAYVVYASRIAAGWLQTGRCSGTRSIDEAAKDLAFFRERAGLPSSGSLRVHTNAEGARQKGPLTIALEHDGSRAFKAKPNRQGEFFFPSLPAGSYTLHYEQDGDMEGDPRVQVRPNGCMETYFHRAPRMTGRLRLRSGEPAAHVEVGAVDGQDLTIVTTMTDEQGRFALRAMEGDPHYLGVNLVDAATGRAPYPRWFHPGTSDRAAATKISFAGERESRYFELTLPDRLPERTVEVVVLNADGTPNASATVRIVTARGDEVANTRGRGSPFLVSLLAGTRYRVLGTTSGLDGLSPTAADPVEIEAGTEPVHLTLRLPWRSGSPTEDQQRPGAIGH